MGLMRMPKVKKIMDSAMHEILLAALTFRSPGVRFALDRVPELLVPTTVVNALAARFDLEPISSDRIETLFREIASPCQRRQLNRDGRVRFIYTFATALFGKQVIGAFRIQAKAVNRRIVLIICENLRRYSNASGRSATTQSNA
jgi:hypothetical protein